MLERGKLDRDGGVRGHRPTGSKGVFAAKGRCSGISERTTQNWQMMPDIRLSTRSPANAGKKPLSGSLPMPRKTRHALYTVQRLGSGDKTGED